MAWETLRLENFIEPYSVRAENIDNFQNLIAYGVSNTKGITITSHKKSEDLSKYLFIEKDCFAYNPYRVNVGSVGLTPKQIKGVVSPAYVVFKTKSNKLLPQLLLAFLKSSEGLHQIKKYARGTVRKALRYEDLCQIKMPIPPIEFQPNILKKKILLDEKLRDLHAEIIAQKRILKQFRQAILQDAIQGKLTVDWRKENPDIEPASELLGRIAAEKAELVKQKKIRKQKPLPPIKPEDFPFAIPDTWSWCKVWDIARIITSGSRDWAKYYSNEGAIFLTMGNLSKGHYELRMNAIRYVKLPKDENASRMKLEANDLLISVTGEVGNLGLIPNDFGEAYINQHTCLLRFMPECQNKYFPEFMCSPWAKAQFNAPQRGIKNSFRLGDVGDIISPIPPLLEQEEIVRRVEAKFALCDKLEEEIVATERNAEHLSTAILQEVFTQPVDVQSENSTTTDDFSFDEDALLETSFAATLRQRCLVSLSHKIIKQTDGLYSIDHLMAMLLATNPENCKDFLTKSQQSALEKAIAAAPQELFDQDQIHWKQSRDYLEDHLKAITIDRSSTDQNITITQPAVSLPSEFNFDIQGIVKAGLQALVKIKQLEKNLSKVTSKQQKVINFIKSIAKKSFEEAA